MLNWLALAMSSSRSPRPARALASCLAFALALGCSEREPAPLDQLLLPSGLALSPDRELLFVTNSNLDGAREGSSLVALELDALGPAIASPAAAGAPLSSQSPCRALEGRERVECDPHALIDPELGVRLPSGAGNLVIDRPAGDQGPLRLLTPTRTEPTLSWVELLGGGYGDDGPLRLDCGAAEDRVCDDLHRLELDRDPSRLTLDNQGFRFAYLPHLLERRLTLFSLDGELGPEIADIERDFFREDELFDSGLGGGFEVVQRACDLATDNVPAASAGCVRPYLFVTQRYWWGLRSFRVAPGVEVVVTGGEETILGPNLEAADPKPLMGGMAFEDPEIGERLLVVHTTPPALSRVDMSLDEERNPRIDVVDTISMCPNPNLVVVHRPELVGLAGPRLAFVSCYGSDQVAAVDLGVFAVVATLELGDGPNEMLIDAERGWLLVANTAESSISVVGLDPNNRGYLREIATLGLGKARAD